MGKTREVVKLKIEKLLIFYSICHIVKTGTKICRRSIANVTRIPQLGSVSGGARGGGGGSCPPTILFFACQLSGRSWP